MKKIIEDKKFIFDFPKEAGLRYYRHKIKAFFAIRWYKLILNMLVPKIEKKRFYVSLCAIFKDEAKYLHEWIEFHKIVGVEHFYMYNNFSEDNYIEVLQPYIDKGLVTLTDWPIKQGQMSAYKDCVDKYGEESNWIGFIDLDEYVVPNERETIGAILESFEKRPYLLVYWLCFTSSGFVNRNVKDGLVTEDFTLCFSKYSDIGKLFFNTAFDYADELPQNRAMHHRWGRLKGRIYPPFNCCDNPCVYEENKIDSRGMSIQINHYLLKSYEEYKAKKKRGGGVHADMHDEAYFWMHEKLTARADYHIFKYMIKLKQAMNKCSDKILN